MATFKIDPNHSSIEFSARHMMVTNVRGRFTSFDGQVEIDENLDPATARGTVTMAADSITTNNEQRDGHLQSADFFDAATYPDLKFVTTKVEPLGDGYKVTGDLTIRDVTRPVQLEVVVEEPFIDPFGLQRVSLTATGTINRYDWGLTWNQTLEAGRVLVSQNIKLTIEAAFVRPAAAAPGELAEAGAKSA